MKVTRRTALKGMGAAALTPLVPGCTTGDGPSPDGGSDPPATIADRIDTVVVVMMENRSFDHYLGALSLEEGRTDVDGLTSSMSNPLADGTAVGPYPADQFCQLDPPHGWNASHDQWNGGANDGFVREHEDRHGAAEGHRVMGYWRRDDVTTHFELADAGAICARWFSSVMGPTWPNRYYSLLATSMGNQSNDPIPDELPTIFERVYNGGKSYGVYYGNIPFAALCARVTIEDPEYRPLEQFYEHAAAGTLPNLVWIDPLYGRNSDHPPEHPKAGQVLMQSIYRALAESPQWERCLFVITYDEHGGFFDHVAPPTIDDDFAEQGLDQLGFRIPAIVTGPWVKEGHVSTTVLNHTSIMKTLSELWDLEPLRVRDAASNSFLDVIDMDRIASGEARPPVSLTPIDATDEELYAEGCLAELPFAASPWLGRTGQPELEALVAKRWPNHPKIRVAETDETYERLLAIAERQGTLRRASGARRRRG